MRNLLRRTVLVVIVLAGLLHLLGAAEGLRWADVSALQQPVSTVAGLGWLAGRSGTAAGHRRSGGTPRGRLVVGRPGHGGVPEPAARTPASRARSASRPCSIERS